MKGKHYIYENCVVNIHKVDDKFVYLHNNYGVLIKEDIAFFDTIKPVEWHNAIYYIGKYPEQEIRQILDQYMEKYSPITYQIFINLIRLFDTNGTVFAYINFDAKDFYAFKNYQHHIFNRIDDKINILHVINGL